MKALLALADYLTRMPLTSPWWTNSCIGVSPRWYVLARSVRGRLDHRPGLGIPLSQAA